MTNPSVKKLSIFLPSLMGGGAERVMVVLANEFIARGFSVDLVLVKVVGPYLADLHPAVQIIDLDAKRLILSIGPLIKYIRTERPRVMLSALVSANIIAVISRALSRWQFKLVISERAVSSVALRNNPLFKAKLIPFLMRMTYFRADKIIAVASGVEDDLVENFKLSRDKISVIYNPVVTSRLVELSREEVNHEWFDNENVPVIVSAGRLTSQKNFNLLIRSFALLLETQNARLVILGSGQLLNDLQQLAIDLKVIDKILFAGFVDNPFSWFRKASLFVLSSDYEGLPGALIQAMACGTPVVSTDCPSGPREILENGKWGRLVPVGDVSALSKAMRNTLLQKNNPLVTTRAQFFDVRQGVDSYGKALGLIKTDS
ncbi:glycosyltransferase [bacterium]|nr:glycosyltransferase [bacterium]